MVHKETVDNMETEYNLLRFHGKSVSYGVKAWVSGVALAMGLVLVLLCLKGFGLYVGLGCMQPST